MMSNSLDRRVYVRDLKEYFRFEQITGDESSLDRFIIAPDVNRPGLELSGYALENDLRRVLIIGNKECIYLKTLDEETKRRRFDLITDSFTPCIIFTSSNDIPQSLIEIASSKNFPIFRSADVTYRVITDIVAYLDKHLAVSHSVHGVMMSIFGMGVLLMGPSGIGKSELAIELVSRGHNLIGDDRVDIIRAHNDLVCFAPKVLKGLLELRGVGIVDVGLMYGASSVLDSCNLDLVVSLQPFDENKEYNRLSVSDLKFELFGLQKPLLEVPVKAGRAMSVIVEAAVINHRLRQKGIDSGEVLRQRVMEEIKKNGGQR